ncbi:hypothetical protein AC1031_007154 [Aphanomyces cochlioides]|nr:hypothetical protein AC1031_007154 [Aphanomyces cochlioides]
MGPPKTENVAKSLLSRQQERRRFDSADWAMNLAMNSENEAPSSSATESPVRAPSKEAETSMPDISALELASKPTANP